jgi:hypothetical protein
MRRLLASFVAIAVLGLSVAAKASTLYTDGTSTYADAELISAGPFGPTLQPSAIITDSFTLSQSDTVTGIDFVAWIGENDPLSSVDWSIGNSAFGTDLGSGTVDPNGNYLQTNSGGPWYVYDETFSIPGQSLAAGTYYLTLSNAYAGAPGDDLVFWDINTNGTSTSEITYLGRTSSAGHETFDILGTENTSAATPEPSSLTLIGTGVLSLVGVARKRFAGLVRRGR